MEYVAQNSTENLSHKVNCVIVILKIDNVLQKFIKGDPILNFLKMPTTAYGNLIEDYEYKKWCQLKIYQTSEDVDNVFWSDDAFFLTELCTHSLLKHSDNLLKYDFSNWLQKALAKVTMDFLDRKDSTAGADTAISISSPSTSQLLAASFDGAAAATSTVLNIMSSCYPEGPIMKEITAQLDSAVFLAIMTTLQKVFK